MKRKAIVLLSSVLASALLVGGSFAAYAVTDNADPFGINVTPGDLDVDDTTYVTLNWGDSTGLTGIGNLKVGENRKAGIVSLKATPAYTGVFSVTLQDNTSVEKEVGDAKLLDYLNVYVYDGNKELGSEGELPEGIVKASILATSESKTVTANLEGTPAGRELSVFVNLDSSASPVYTQMSQDKVRLTVDWSPKSGDEATDNVVYATKPSAWTDMYAFAWKGEKVNATWPGVKMVKAYDDVYQISIPNDMESIIFNDGNSGEGHQTGDLSLTGYTAAHPYWDATEEEWTAKPTPEVGLVMSATVNGEDIALINVKEGGTDRAVYKVTLATGQKIKFKEGATDVHFYHYDQTQEKNVDDGIEYTAIADGLHTFYYNKDSQMFVGQPEAPVAAPVFYLLGDHNEWKMSEAAQLTVDPTDGNHYTSAVLALSAGSELKVRDASEGDGVWYNNADTYPNCGYTISDDSDRNVVVSEAGNYIIHFYVASDYNNHITLAKQA